MIKGSVIAKPQVFAAAVKWAAGYLDGRPTNPVYGGLLLSAADGLLTITAVNEYVSAVATITVDGMGEGRAIVSGRLLKDLTATFPTKPVEISGEGEDSVILAAGRWRGTLPAFTEGDYPAMPTAPPALGRVEGNDFARVVAEAAAATSSDADRQAQWRSVRLVFGEATVTAYGTDNYRAARGVTAFETVDGDARVGASALVLATQMSDVAAGFIGPDPVRVGLDETSMSLASDTRQVVIRLMDPKEYPADLVVNLTAREWPDIATVVKADLLAPMKRAALVREKDGPITVGFGEDLITLAAASEQMKRDGAEEIDAAYAGEPVTLHLNPAYFGDALSTAPGEIVEIGINPAGGPGGRPSPVILRVADKPWRHILVPIQKR